MDINAGNSLVFSSVLEDENENSNNTSSQLSDSVASKIDKMNEKMKKESLSHLKSVFQT